MTRCAVCLLALTVALSTAALSADPSASPSAPAAPATRDFSREELLDRIHGGWSGMLIGGIEGLTHEFKYNAQPRESLPELALLPQGARSDDDNDFELTHLYFMDKEGTLKLPYTRIVEIWKANMNKGIWVANKRARELMDQGMIPPATGDPENNKHSSYNLSGQFCTESYGMIAPGMPQAAADLGAHYAHIAVSGEPIQAAQYWTTLVSLNAFRTGGLEEVLRESLAAVDPSSAHKEAVEDAIKAYRENPDDWKTARQTLYKKWVLERNWNGNSTPANGALVILALLYGKDDFCQSLRYAMAMGLDADCNAATAGAIIGVRMGFKKIAALPHFAMPDIYRNLTRPQLPAEMKISEQAELFLRVCERVILENGGEKIEVDGKPGYRIALQEPRVIERLGGRERPTTQQGGASEKQNVTAVPRLSTDFAGGQLGKSEWVGPDHLRAVLYREWDENRVNTQATWYYFRLDGVQGVPLTIELTGLNDVYEGRPSHSIAERDKPFFSNDNVHWQRLLSSEFDAARSTLTIRITPQGDTVWIAHLEPYTEEHLNRLVADFKGSPYLRVESAGKTVERRELPLWTITDPAVPEAEKKVVWLMGRQHAWETHTSFCLDGAARFLLAETPEAAALRRRLLVRLLPMMDPDGVARGGTRFNRLGYDVNRHWNEVRIEDPEAWKKMPEIASGKRAVGDWLAAGHRIDLFLAFHDTQVDSFSMAPANDPAMLKLHALLKECRFSGKASGAAGPRDSSSVAGALNYEFGFPAGLFELGTVDLPSYGRYVTAPDRVPFGADLVVALGKVFASAEK